MGLKLIQGGNKEKKKTQVVINKNHPQNKQNGRHTVDDQLVFTACTLLNCHVGSM